MPRESQEVAAHSLHVHRHVGHGLRAVNQHYGAFAVRGRGDLLHRHDGAKHVGRGRHGHQLRALGDHLVQVVGAQATVLRHAEEAQARTRSLGGQLPRHQVRVVLDGRHEDLVAFLQVAPRPAVGHQVDGFRRILDEYDGFRFRRIDEARHFAARFLIAKSSLLAQRVDGAVDVGVVFLVEAANGLDHGPRLLRRSCAVQIHQRPAVDRLAKDREIPANRLNVYHALIFRSMRLTT